MNKQKILNSIFLGIVWLSILNLGGFGTASMGITTLEIENVEWIVPNVTKIGYGYRQEFAFSPDGTVQIVTIDTDEYSESLKYIDNSTGTWDDFSEIADPQYGAEHLGILVDSKNHTHVSYQGDGGGVYHLNNSDIGVLDFTEESMSQTSSLISSPRMALGPNDSVHMVYHWFDSDSSGYTGTLIYYNNTDFEPHLTNNTGIRYEQYADIAVDSNGIVHIVYEGSWNNTALGNVAVRDVFYQTFNPGIAEPEFSDPIQLTSVQTTMDYVQTPRIICDENDNLHVSFLESEPYVENGLTVHRFNFKYMLLDADPSSADAQTVNNKFIRNNVPSMAIDTEGNVHVAYVGYPQGEYDHYFKSDIIYSTNSSGDWVSERITNQPYDAGFPRIAINPITDKPILLYLIKQEYVNAGPRFMEYVEMQNGEFGTHFNLTASLAGNGDNAQIIQEEAYSYIQLVRNQPLKLELDLLNPYSEAKTYDIELKLIENDYVSLENGTAAQTVGSINGNENQEILWNFSVSGSTTGILEVHVSHDGDIIGKILFHFNVGSGGSNINIPFANGFQIAFWTVLTSSVVVIRLKMKKK